MRHDAHGYRKRHVVNRLRGAVPMIGILIAVLVAALVYALCLALNLPAIVAIVAAILVLLSGIGTGGYGYGRRGL
jgi:hypothetical protein